MSVPKYRLDAIETIGRKILQEYDPVLLDGPPQAVPIETIIETKFDLTLEYHCLRKNGSILGETIFDEGAAILYDQDEKRYRLIAVKAGTILVEERLCVDRLLGRLRFTCAHELGHWVLHQKLYSGTGDVAAYEGKTSLDESHGLVEWQADALATALLMPLPQIKRSFYRLRAGRSNEQLVAEMAQIFQVSKQAINTPEHIILEQMKKEALYQAISALPAADQALVQGLFFKGQSELDYAREIGVSQPAVHKRKVRILKSLKKLLEN